MAQDPNKDPFEALGGGVRIANGDWVMKGMTGADGPLWNGGGQPQAPAPAPAPGAPPPAYSGIDGPNKAAPLPTPQTAGQALTGQATVGQQPQQGQQATVAGSFQQALLNKLTQGPVTADSAQLKPSLDANKLAEQRGFERDRAMLAERNAAQGLNMSGGNESQLLGLAQDRTAREGQFAGNAVADANKQQSAEILAALGLGGNLLGDQDRMNLQRYGIDTDAQLRREGLGASTSLGRDDLALRDKLGSGNLNLGLAGLLQGGQQFGQSLGLQAGMGQAQLNQQALLSLLGGL
jgi:hypothetical protein